jgi:uncharacterized protein YgbK (DUF1537 family)
MKTVVLDDDPTGTQSTTGVTVLLEWNGSILKDVLDRCESVYLLTNTRAIDREAAITLVSQIRHDVMEAAEALGVEVQFVLRGDSTLRGHVFEEIDVFVDERSVIVFVPAFPDGGRTTVGGTHFVEVGGVRRPADQSEYALDPVFPFATAYLPDYVSEKSGRGSHRVCLDDLRASSSNLADSILEAPAGTVILPDAETNTDIRLIAAGIIEARARGASIVVRSAAPLAAELAGVSSDGLLPDPLVAAASQTLLVCGSHTDGATKQLREVEKLFGKAQMIDTDMALADPIAHGRDVATRARTTLESTGFAAIATARDRLPRHNTLEHGAQVMLALTTAVQEVRAAVDVVVAKGGITSADIARHGLGARSAVVRGQVLAGVSVWDLVSADDESKLYVVVPGNVGAADTIVNVLRALRLPRLNEDSRH